MKSMRWWPCVASPGLLLLSNQWTLFSLSVRSYKAAILPTLTSWEYCSFYLPHTDDYGKFLMHSKEKNSLALVSNQWYIKNRPYFSFRSKLWKSPFYQLWSHRNTVHKINHWKQRKVVIIKITIHTYCISK